MTPRERVVKSLRHEQPDTVPLFLEPTRWKPFCLPDGSPCHIPDMWNPLKDEKDDWVVYNQDGIVTARMPRGGFYFEPTHAPLSQITDVSELKCFADEIESFDWPLFLDQTLNRLGERAKTLFTETDLAITGNLQLHSCGSVYRFIPWLIEAGVDALNPVQVSAAEMDTFRLKQEFGRDITFWGGGCDTQHVLRTGTKVQIEEEVRRRMEDLAPEGGFVFAQVHNVQPDVSPENVMAMVEAFEKYRRL